MTNRNNIFIFILILFHSSIMAQGAHFKETWVTLPTYPYSEPNPIAEAGTIYPYFRFDGYTAMASDRQWKMIEMENDYIKLWITPEIGGKIWGAIEKSTGKEFIYFNHTVKFRDIAMRGPWTSGGMELNFGVIGHAPTCASPVDYLLHTNPDGSVSCFLGAIDLPSRTRWSVEVMLPGDKAYFVTRSKWDNSSLTEQSYYQWMNVGVKTAGNLEYIYPGKNYLGHDGQSYTWPEDNKGREISWYQKNNFGSYKSYHVFGSYTDFFGGYWHDDDFGFGHYARYDDKPGKKIWIWGLSQQGMIWEDLLTDSDGQYSEIQSGRLFNQESSASTLTPFKHRDFGPAATDMFEEYWFPVNGTKGLKYGLPPASVNLTRENGQLVLRLCPNMESNSLLEIRSTLTTLFSQQIRFEPQKTLTFYIETNQTPEECTLWLDGQLFYDGNPVHAHILRPTGSPDAMNWNSAYGHFLQGKEWERQRLFQKAIDEYDACLAIEPYFVPSLDGMAHIRFRTGDNKKSQEYALKALQIDTYDGMANYYYGLSSLELGDTISALDGLSIATAALNYRSAAYNVLARIHLAKQNYNLALDYAQKSLMYNFEGSIARQIEALALRHLKRIKEAEQKLTRMKLVDPLDHFGRIERYLSHPTTENAQSVKRYISNEFPSQTFLEYAIAYHALGQNDDARRILSLSPSAVLVDYWVAYLAHLEGDESAAKASLDLALNADPVLVFPFRKETRQVLEWALQTKNHWKSKYYLGLLELVQGHEENARFIWQDCQDVPDFYPFYIVRAKLTMNNDSGATGHDLELALQYGESQWQAGRAVAEIYDALGNHVQALTVCQKYYALFPSNYYLGLQYAGYLNRSGKFTASIDILQKINVLPNEGATAGRDTWRNSNLNLAVDRYKQGEYTEALQFVNAASQFPLNLGVGRTYVTDERIEDFISALCYRKMDLSAQVENFERKIIATLSDREEAIKWNSSDLISAFLLKKYNREDEALGVIKALEKEVPDNPSTRWSKAIYNGDYDTAAQIVREHPATGNIQSDKSYPILVRLHRECGIFKMN